MSSGRGPPWTARRSASSEPASAWASDQGDEFGPTLGPVGAVADHGRQPGRRNARPGQGRRRAPRRIEQVGPAAGHPGPEVGTDRAQDDHDPAGHVFAAVRAEPLDDRLRAAVADGEAHPGPADEMESPCRRPEQAHVADQGGRGRVGDDLGLGTDDDRPARQALADVVVGLTHEVESKAAGQERPEALSGRAAQLEPELVASGISRAAGRVDLAALDGARQLGAE